MNINNILSIVSVCEGNRAKESANQAISCRHCALGWGYFGLMSVVRVLLSRPECTMYTLYWYHERSALDSTSVMFKVCVIDVQLLVACVRCMLDYYLHRVTLNEFFK